MNNQSQQNYKIWKNFPLKDDALVEELNHIANDKEAIHDRFYCNLAFGTGGLRGVLGVGTNRMNIYTVGKATKGYANYLLSKNPTPSIAIAYDSRINSEVFAYHVAGIMAVCGVKVYIWKELMPTPSLSFAVRYLGCDGGIVITASHNPSEYNGYKVYGNDGCQITTEMAGEILTCMEAVDIFKDVPEASFEEEMQLGKIAWIEEEVFDAYLTAVSKEAFITDEIDKSLKIAYTPLYGAGLRCVTEVLKRNGFQNIVVVEEQAKPNGYFPTCPYPNPEMREALEIGLNVAKEVGAELLMATDPDCDRVGIAVKSGKDYILLSGNEVGMLLLDYICKQRLAQKRMPQNPICIKTIVTIDMAERIAHQYNVEIRDVLTGFKFIGEQIGFLESKGEEECYIFGFEESYGYLSGSYVRDKDAVNASLLIAEMFAYYKSYNQSLLDILKDLYQRFGYCLNTLHSFEFAGESGMNKMEQIMTGIREEPPVDFGGKKVLECRDYFTSKRKKYSGEIEEIILPKSNVLKFILEDHTSLVLRPSGTEPKLKIYISVSVENENQAREVEEKILRQVERILV